MKSFKQFNEEYNREKHMKKLDKTANSLNNHLSRSRNAWNSHRAHVLVSRYDDLRNHMIDKDNEGWRKYCKDRGASHLHQGRDLMA